MLKTVFAFAISILLERTLEDHQPTGSPGRA
jgi:hypothetical protein